MIYLALIHYPVLNKNGEIVTTALTNFDLHDICRTARTYGITKCFMVTPVPAQVRMVEHIKKYWQEGYGATYNADRKEAFSLLEISPSIEETCLTIKGFHGTPPHLVATSAKRHPYRTIPFSELAKICEGSLSKPLLLLFGTGWGLAPAVLESVGGVLEPIVGPTDYNHLPVRSAIAIILDRLLGRKGSL